MRSKPFQNQSTIIGIDFDNTIINYDEVVYKIACERNFIPASFPHNKQKIKDAIVALPEGHVKWQEVQAIMYGERIQEAKLTPGLLKFIQECENHGFQIYVISHKTKYSNLLTNSRDFKSVALQWMSKNIFSPESSLLPSLVYFEPTREEKIKRIAQLRCTHFIDDLEEVFLEPNFPNDIIKILYAPNRDAKKILPKDITLRNNWEEIHAYFFS